MRHTMRFILCMLVVVFLFGGCARPKDLHEASLPRWELRTPNPLLYYVPADAPLIMATQRNTTLQNPGVQYIMKRNGRRELTELQKLMYDFTANAPAWGLDPNGEMDAVGYVKDHNTIVLHFTVADEFKAMSKLDERVMHFNKQLALRGVKGIDFDYPDDEYEDLAEAKKDPELVEILDQQGESKTWRVYQLKSEDYLTRVGVHARGGVVSVVLATEDTNAFDEVLRVQDNYYRPDDVDKDALLVFHADYEKSIRTLLSNQAFIDQIDDEFISSDLQYVLDMDDDEYDKFCDDKLEYCGESYLRHWEWRNRYYDDDIHYDSYDQKYLCTDESKSDEVKWVAEKDARLDKIARVEAASKKLVKNGKERSHKLGISSIGDEVCINDLIEALDVKDYNILDVQLLFSPQGMPGMVFSQKITSDAIYNDVNSWMTDHLDIKDYEKHPGLYGSLSMNIAEIINRTTKRFIAMKTHRWSCTQVKYWVKERMDRVMRELDDSDTQEFIDVLKTVSSVTGQIATLSGRGDQYWFNIRGSERAMQWVTDELFDEKAGEEVIVAKRHGVKHMIQLVDHKDLLIGTKFFDLQKLDLNARKKDFLAHLYIGRDIQDVRFLRNMLDLEVVDGFQVTVLPDKHGVKASFVFQSDSNAFKKTEIEKDDDHEEENEYADEEDELW